jgi:pteridine reductase
LSTKPTETLTGRTALVTGAARRIGAAIAARLHAAGANVAIHFNASRADAVRLSGDLNSIRGGSARIFQADLTNVTELEPLVAEVAAWTGRLDALVNNASSFYPTPLGQVTPAQWEDLVGTNLRAPLFLAQAAWPYLRQQHGSIVNIVDIHSRRPLRSHSVYGSAKAGLAMLTRSLAKDMAPQVRVNGVSPGAILWPAEGMTEETRHTILQQVPLGRAGDPDDIAGCVLYLVRDASYVTGQVIAVDGGRSIGW